MDDVRIARYDRVFDAYACGAEYLTKDCFVRHTQRLAELRGQSPDSPAVVALDAELAGIWEMLATMADTDGDGRVSRDEWRAAGAVVTASMLEAEANGTGWPAEAWVERLFEVIDADGDGSITKREYGDWLTAFGFDADTDIDDIFPIFDTDGDGVLSREEFSHAYHQYWSNFDPTIPAQRWLGP